MVVAAVAAAVVAVAAVVALLAARSARDDARRRGDALDAELATARRELASVRDELASARAALEAARVEAAAGDALMRTLWSLELLRVAREWAVTGGEVPGGDESVAAHTGAELTMALRMELERRREESGIPGELAPPTAIGAVPVPTALGALRLVEEVLAVVARPSEGLVVGAVVEDGALVVTVTLDAADADVPAVVQELAAGAGGSIVVEGSSVTLRLPAC